eukprot:scaffold22701_cov123-Cylindrotheca_fusiformis.AAC.10
MASFILKRLLKRTPELSQQSVSLRPSSFSTSSSLLGRQKGGRNGWGIFGTSGFLGLELCRRVVDRGSCHARLND